MDNRLRVDKRKSLFVPSSINFGNALNRVRLTAEEQLCMGSSPV